MKNKILDVQIKGTESYSYPIIFGYDFLSRLGDSVKQYTKASKLFIISNEKVFSLYGEKTVNSLKEKGFLTEVFLMKDGESFKNFETFENILTKAIEIKLERKDAFIALGGGVVGDITGFAAASYLRGIDFIQIPTTLLAQVDSSVGGKVAINHKLGKNLIGAFYQPKFVYTDLKTLETLPEKELKTGLAEVLKYGFIEKSCGLKEPETDLIKFLKDNKDNIYKLNPDIMTFLVEYCCKLKAAVVNQDEKESGVRVILNFGHTIGHAIEKCTDYKTYTHGEAVAMGIIGILHLSKDLNLINSDYFNESINLLNQYGLNYKLEGEFTGKELIKSMFSDKKVIGGKLRFVMPVEKGKVDIFNNIDENIIKKAISLL